MTNKSLSDYSGENRFRTLVENSSEGIALVDESLYTIYRSPAALKIIGDLDYNSIMVRSHPEDVKLIIEKKNEALSKPGYPVSFQGRFMHNSQYYIWLEGTVTNLLHVEGVNAFLFNYRDITQRKEAEIKLEQSVLQHALLTSIINSSEDAIISKTLDGIITSWNKSAQNIFGFTEAEAIGQSITIIIPPELVHEEPAILSKLRSGQHINHYETLRMHKDKTRISISLAVSPVIDKNGIVVGASKIARDITRKKEEEHHLKLLESVITNTNDAVIITKASEQRLSNSRIIYVNNAFTKLTGFTALEANGAGIDLLMGEKTDPKSIAFLQDSLQRWISCDLNMVNYRKNGETFWSSISVSPVANEHRHFTHWIFIIKDITSQKLAEKALINSLYEKKTILESIGDGFYTVDKTWIVTYWNPQAEKALLIPTSLILGKCLWDVFSNSMDTVSYFKYNEAVNTQEIQHFEDYYPKLDRWFCISAYPSPTGLSVYFKDISDRKLSEIQLLKLNEDLKRQQLTLKESNIELEQFAYIASHDLQEPLRMITGFLTQLEKKYYSILDAKGKQYIDFAVDGARRMRQIILDLLEFSMIGKKAENNEPIDLNEIIEEIKILFIHQIRSSNAVISITDSLPTVFGYKAPLRQVFQNLISNSLKYVKPETDARIAVSAKDLGEFWQFSIMDNGIGIDGEYFDKIFIIFQRLHSKQEYSGTGIGLSVAKKIIEKLGGAIWLESTEGLGSTFHFTISKQVKRHE